LIDGSFDAEFELVDFLTVVLVFPLGPDVEFDFVGGGEHVVDLVDIVDVLDVFCVVL
jgi:hypothetical protein